MEMPINNANTKSNPSAKPPPHLPRVYPNWKRTQQSTDIPPTRIRIQKNKLSASDANDCGDVGFGSNKPKPKPPTRATITGVEVCLGMGICPTCHKNEARYTCPRCLAPYCSMACYQIHDIHKPSSVQEQTQAQAENNTGGNDAAAGGGRCTEAFYRDKVQQISNLAVKDEGNVSQMRDILTRSHYDGDDVEEDRDENGKNMGLESTILTDEELVELAEYVLKLDDDDNEYQSRVLTNNDADPRITTTTSRPDLDLPMHLRHKFELAVRRGELSHLIQEEHNFHPYWLPQRQVQVKAQAHTEESLMFGSETLEERICAIPPLPLAFPLSSSGRKVHLQFNICEVLYVTAWTLRRYHMDVMDCGERKHKRRRVPQRESAIASAGAQKNDNSTRTMKEKDYDSNDDAIIDITSFIYIQSQVLSHDARYSSIEEMLMACTERTRLETIRHRGVTVTASNGNLSGRKSNDDDEEEKFGNNVDWVTLLNDIIHMSKHRRMVLRILLDANDMIHDGSKALKRRRKGGQDDINTKGMNTIQRSNLKLATKKMEYYMSWCQTYWDDIGSEISGEIERWMNDWKHIVDDTDVKKDEQGHVGDMLHVIDDKKFNDPKPPSHEFNILSSENRGIIDVPTNKDDSFLVPVSTRKLTG